MSRAKKEKLYKLLEEQKKRLKYNLIDSFMTDSGPTARNLYPKSLELYAAGAKYRERAFFGANRVGKTTTAAIEVAYHLTGLYPTWWVGHRFKKAPVVWAVGVDTVQVKNVIQKLLLGNEVDFGSGLIKKDLIIGKPTSKPGAASGTVEDAFIKHASGGTSKLTFKSYQQSVKSFYGDAIDLVWFDEEPLRPIYDECLMRLVSTQGLILATFTPLIGFSNVVLQYLPDRKFPEDNVVKTAGVSKYIIRAEWEDVPHLDKKTRDELLASILPHMREARSKGIPCVGEGKVYPVEETSILLDNILLQEHWLRCYAIHVSYNGVKILFAALDKEKDVLYIYDEYTAGDLPPVIHASAIRKRGSWLQGVFKYNAVKANQQDAYQIYSQYVEEGLNIYKSDVTMRAGISAVYSRIVTGRLKVVSTCENWLHEFRGYAYDELGNIQGKSRNLAQDAFMEATHSLVIDGINVATIMPDEINNTRRFTATSGKNAVTGY